MREIGTEGLEPSTLSTHETALAAELCSDAARLLRPGRYTILGGNNVITMSASVSQTELITLYHRVRRTF